MIGSVRIYHNNGDSSRPYPDFDTVRATVNAGVQQWTSPPLSGGVWAFGLRVFNGQFEEQNTHTFVLIRVRDQRLIENWPAQPILLAENRAGGTVRLVATVDNLFELTPPADIRFYTNDGAGGAVDYGSAIGTVAVEPRGTGFRSVFTTSAYGETARLFGAVAYSADGADSPRAAEVTITPDSTAPPAPASPGASQGRD